MLPERIERLKTIILDLSQIQQYVPRQQIMYQPDARKSPILRHAESYKQLLEQVSVNHIPGERIVGNNLDKYSPRPNHLLNEELEQIRNYPLTCSTELLTALDEECFYLWSWSDGHILPSYEKVLRSGGTGIIKQLCDRLEDPDLTHSQREFLEAALIQWEAGLHYVSRHREYFERRARESTERKEREYYQELAQVCAHVPANPARSFREALQSVWFTFILGQFDDCSNHSLGRLDQYLYPYYRHDIETGALSAEEARELFLEFWLKFNLGYRLQEVGKIRIEGKGLGIDHDYHDGRSWLSTRAVSETHPDIGQSLDICGLDEPGGDATNEISWMVLEALKELRTFEPKPVVKYTEKTDREFIKECCRLNASGLGLPSFSFHAAGARGLRNYDAMFSDDDILDYSSVGCVETGIPGKSYVDPMNAFINLPKIVLITMNNGYCNGKRVGLELPPTTTWKEFLAGFYRQLDYFVGLYVEGMNTCYPFFARFFFRPFVSTLVEDCIERAVPVDSGGARYWVKGINCTGLATAVDSLYAVKYLVFEEKRLSLEEFCQVLRANYEGREDFRMMIKNRIPKYGNDDPEVDTLAREVVDQYCKIVRRYRTHNGSRYRPGLYSFYGPIKTMGKVTGATPDGRKAGEVLSLNTAPYHGNVRNGLSAVLNSVTAIDHSSADNASTVDVLLSADVPAEVIEHIVTYLGEKSVLHVQFSVVNREDLIQAQRFPEQYQDLVVRVTGFSARFVSLPKDTQDEFIKRSFWN